ncbi:MAG: SgcJ/EcaC family oxidoreductase [Acidobacteria bacterium]|nr:SgcJ/EcaC family oxidoreductase [Acidobacteriota bacterium]
MNRVYSTARSLAVVAILTSFAACAQEPVAPPDTRPADEAAIRAAATDWVKAAEAKDVEKFLSFYADDATVYPPGAPAMSGAEARRKFWTGVFSLPEIQAKIKPERIEAAKSGDIAYELGAFEESFKDPKGKPVNISGKYVVVWKKQGNGQWKAYADIFNTNQ